MKCPYCNEEMEDGFINANSSKTWWSKIKHFSIFNNRVGDVILMAGTGYRSAACCRGCGKIIIEFEPDKVVR
jgi:hypothetical protein